MVRYSIEEKLKQDIEREEKAVIESVKKVLTDEERKAKEQIRFEESKKINQAIFLMLTGAELTEEQFKDYNSKFQVAKKGYNIKTFIKDNNITIIKQEEKKEEKKEEKNKSES